MRARRAVGAALALSVLVVSPSWPAARGQGSERVDTLMELVESTSLEGLPPSDASGTGTNYQLYLTLLHEYRMKQEANRVTECILLSVTLVATLAAVLGVLLWRAPQSTNQILNTTGLVLVVFATVFIVVLADAEQQLTAAMGILGAIVGYLFGSMRRPHPEPASSTAPKEVS